MRNQISGLALCYSRPCRCCFRTTLVGTGSASYVLPDKLAYRAITLSISGALLFNYTLLNMLVGPKAAAPATCNLALKRR